MMTGIHRSGRRIGRKFGFSLIEILVVLVVLLIGILAVLRLFPGGFLTIQRTAERTNAQALARQQMDALKNAIAVPENVIAVLPDANGNLIPQLNVLPDDLADFTNITELGLTANNDIYHDDPYYYSNVNRIRYVLGEAFNLPVGTPNAASGSGGPTYVLQMGPVFRSTTPPPGRDDSISVRGASLERLEQSSAPTNEKPDPTPDLREEQYAIDYERRMIAFFPRAIDASRPNGERRFALRYDYYATDSNGVLVRSVLNGEIRVPDVAPGPDGPLPVWQPFFKNDPLSPTHPLNNFGAPAPADINFSLGMVRDSEDVSRAFRLVASGAWSDDPYEYNWSSPQVAGDIPANVGVLVFNPRGRDQATGSSSGSRAFSARVDYLIYDNHIIRDERAMPNAGPYAIRLSLPFVLQAGDILNDQTAYNGMFQGSVLRSNDTPDVLVYNANTGARVVSISNGVSLPQIAGRNAVELSARAGILRFDPNFVEQNNLRSATLRVYYRAQKEWGMQIQKAQARYVRADVPSQNPAAGQAGMTYRSYYVGGSNGAGVGTRIYFPRAEAGKTIVLGKYSLRTTAGKFVTFSNEAYKIGDNPANFDQLDLPFVDVADLHPELQGGQLTREETGEEVDNIYGGSVKARVAWRSSERWRRIDNETFMAQGPQR